MVKTKFNKIAALTLTLSMVISSSVFASSKPTSEKLNNKAYNSTCVENNKGNINLKSQLDSLVKAGTITQAQEDAAIKLFAPSKNKHFKKDSVQIKVKLDDLVKVGTITQAQEDALIKLATTSIFDKAEIKAELDGFVKAGTITQAQEDAMIKALTPAMTMNMK